MGRAGWSPGSGTGTGEPLKQKYAAEAAAEVPWQVLLGKAETAWPVGLQGEAK